MILMFGELHSRDSARRGLQSGSLFAREKGFLSGGAKTVVEKILIVQSLCHASVTFCAHSQHFCRVY
jgi:hypothetical protein